MGSRLRVSPTVMSRRRPSDPTVFNDCDNIERQMQEDGHKIWGWVIYRSDYSSEEDWQEFLQRLRAETEKSLRCCGGLDMLPSLDYHIFEDKALFDGLDAATIRDHFRAWAATAPEREQDGAGPGYSQRYIFCIQVDRDALNSIVHNPFSPEDSEYRDNRGWVKLIWKDWEPAADDRMIWPADEPIEGIALDHVGWCRTAYEKIMPTMYAMIRSQNEWHREYRRPPRVIH